MKRLTRLWTALAQELGDMLGVRTERDVETVSLRSEDEGLSFWAITLPDYCGDLERALDSGQIEPTSFRGFRKNGRAPAFLRGFLAQVFDCKTGVILSNPSAEAVMALRQLTLIFKKIEVRCSPARERRAVDAFLLCERGVAEFDSRFPYGKMDRFRRLFDTLFGHPISVVERDIESYSLDPKHGPGATADRLAGNKKWTFPSWNARLETDNLFPFSFYGASRYGALSGYQTDFPLPPQEPPARMVLVPKTQKTPRIIAEEPTCMQYMQQGIKNSLVPAIERDLLVGPLIGFRDQEPNRLMAYRGSLDGSLATIDLSEASDRVSNELVIQATRHWAVFSEAVQATRTRRIALPTGRVLRVSKFAAMGSALCFPIEAMVFLTIVLYGIEEAVGRQLREADIIRLHGNVRVYGDDIIVPVEYAPAVISALEAFGLKVNPAKTHHGGLFRESCGGDFFRGTNVTPMRLNRLAPVDTASEDSILALENWVSFSNRMHKAGWWRTAREVADVAERYLGELPLVESESQALGLHSFLPASSGTRMSPSLHVPQVKAWVVKRGRARREIDGYPALAKWFRGEYGDPLYRDHLVYSGRPAGVKLIRQWVEVANLAPWVESQNSGG